MKKRKPDRCTSWPDCVCGEHWRHFQNAPTEHFEHAAPVIEAMLACVRERCPDRRFRAQAALQLIRPIFAEAGGER